MARVAIEAMAKLLQASEDDVEKARHVESLASLLRGMRMSQEEIDGIPGFLAEHGSAFGSPDKKKILDLQFAAPEEEKPKKRRDNQDYTKLDLFLTSAHWDGMGKRSSLKDRTRYLLTTCHDLLEMRLPSEPTQAVLVAIVALYEGAQDDAVLRQICKIVKSEWKSLYQKTRAIEGSSKELLMTLPESFEELPEHIRNLYGEARPAPAEQRWFSERQVQTLANRVRLRGDTPTEIDALGILGAHMLMRELRGRGREPNDINLQILQPSPVKKRLQLPAPALPAAPQAMVPIVPPVGSRLALPAPAAGDEAEEPSHNLKETEVPESQAAKPTVAAQERALAVTSALEENLRPGPPKKRPAAASGSQTELKEETCDEEEDGPPVFKKPAAKRQKTQKVKPSQTEEEPAEEFKNCWLHAKGYGKIRVEYYTKKSYIRQVNKEGGLSMIIGSSHKQHKHITKKLVTHVMQGKSRKDLERIRADVMRGL